jgi:hypothetical protein
MFPDKALFSLSLSLSLIVPGHWQAERPCHGEPDEPREIETGRGGGGGRFSRTASYALEWAVFNAKSHPNLPIHTAHGTCLYTQPTPLS